MFMLSCHQEPLHLLNDYAARVYVEYLQWKLHESIYTNACIKRLQVAILPSLYATTPSLSPQQAGPHPYSKVRGCTGMYSQICTHFGRRRTYTELLWILETCVFHVVCSLCVDRWICKISGICAQHADDFHGQNRCWIAFHSFLRDIHIVAVVFPLILERKYRVLPEYEYLTTFHQGTKPCTLWQNRHSCAATCNGPPC